MSFTLKCSTLNDIVNLGTEELMVCFWVQLKKCHTNWILSTLM